MSIRRPEGRYARRAPVGASSDAGHMLHHGQPRRGAGEGPGELKPQRHSLSRLAICAAASPAASPHARSMAAARRLSRHAQLRACAPISAMSSPCATAHATAICAVRPRSAICAASTSARVASAFSPWKHEAQCALRPPHPSSGAADQAAQGPPYAVTMPMITRMSRSCRILPLQMVCGRCGARPPSPGRRWRRWSSIGTFEVVEPPRRACDVVRRAARVDGRPTSRRAGRTLNAELPR